MSLLDNSVQCDSCGQVDPFPLKRKRWWISTRSFEKWNYWQRRQGGQDQRYVGMLPLTYCSTCRWGWNAGWSPAAGSKDGPFRDLALVLAKH